MIKKHFHVLCIVFAFLIQLQMNQIRASPGGSSLPHVDDCNFCSKCIVDEEPSRKMTTIKDLMVICLMYISMLAHFSLFPPRPPEGRIRGAEEDLTSTSSQPPPSTRRGEAEKDEKRSILGPLGTLG